MRPRALKRARNALGRVPARAGGTACAGALGAVFVFVAALALAPSAAAREEPGPGLASVESEHFAVRFDPERDWVLAAPALEALEAGRAAVAAWLGEETDGRVPVVVAPTVAEFRRLSGLTPEDVEGAGAVGVADASGIVLLSPRLLLRGYRWRDALNHEYVHHLLVRRSGDRAPVWLQEGLARLGERRWRAADAPFLDDVDRSLVARALREGRLLTLADMSRTLVRLPDLATVRLAFAECALAVDHLIARHGVEGLRRLVAELRRAPADGGPDEALRAGVGETLAGFEEGWRASLGSLGFRELPGLQLPPRRLAGQGAPEDFDLAEWQPLAAQDHLRLGDLLRGRGNARAALREYEKARALAPGSAYTLVKVARALLELGRPEEAAAAAREAQRVGDGYPAASVALAGALAAVGDGAGAAAALREALECNPFDPYAWRDLGRLLRRIGRAQQAQEASVTALRLRPGDQEFMRSVMQD